MKNNVKKQLEEELSKYIENRAEFTPYYSGMNILSSDLYKEQLKEALELVKTQNEAEANSFELYLDTIVVNMHTKAKKYKKSIYFDSEKIKDIQNQGYTIVFFEDEKNNKYVLLGLLKSKEAS